MAQSVVVHRKQKIEKVFNEMQNINDLKEFKKIFKSMFPNDWLKIQRIYQKHKINNKGKRHPMPKPEIYLSNMHKTYLKKRQLENTKD